MENKKVLIITMTCGEGHNQIAKAINNALVEKNIDVKIIQLHGYSEKAIMKVNKSFLNVCKYIPYLYDSVWKIINKRNPELKEKGITKILINKCKDYILKEIFDYGPNAIVCTHNNCGAVVGYLRQKEKISPSIKLFGFVFDYCLCPYWETNTDLDYVILPHENLIDEMIYRGFKKEQLITLGLPVDKRFTIKLDRNKTREELNLEKERFIVVLYSGGNCASPNLPLIKELLKAKVPLQIVSICGKNKKQKDLIDEYIEKNQITNIQNIGFCTCLDKYYSAADVVFTRGGGMGLTEQINKHIPFVLREKLIINEKINKKLFEKLEMGIAMNNIKEAKSIVEILYYNPQLLKAMSQKSMEFSKPNATSDFVNFLINTIK